MKDPVCHPRSPKLPVAEMEMLNKGTMLLGCCPSLVPGCEREVQATCSRQSLLPLILLFSCIFIQWKSDSSKANDLKKKSLFLFACFHYLLLLSLTFLSLSLLLCCCWRWFLFSFLKWFLILSEKQDIQRLWSRYLCEEPIPVAYLTFLAWLQYRVGGWESHSSLQLSRADGQKKPLKSILFT